MAIYQHTCLVQAKRTSCGKWLKLVETKQNYLARIQVAVSQLHNCGATHLKTVAVREIFRGQTVWDGEVEVFELTGHPQASRAYAWSHREGENEESERFVAVLEIPPVVSALSAVRASIMAEAKKRRETSN